MKKDGKYKKRKVIAVAKDIEYNTLSKNMNIK